MATLTVARSPQELTPEWLTSALRAGGALREARVTAVTSEPVGAGSGFIGQLARVRLTYDRAEAGAPASLIAKIPTQDPGGRQIGDLFRFYERENRFYEQIAGSGGLRVPRRYYTATDPDAGEFILLIEDMAPACVADQMAGCSIEHAELAMRGIAKFHAAWWESPKLAQLDWMPDINAPVMQAAQGSYQMCLAPFCQMFGEGLSDELRTVGEALQTHVIDIQDEFNRPPRTINHGDFRGDNMFFATAQGGDPFAIADWQISSKGRGAFDLSYFMSNSLTPADRRAHEVRLLHLWHDTLVENGVQGYPFEQALRDYRLGVLYAWMYVVIAVASLDPANDRGMALFKAWFERATAAMTDLNVAELMPK